MEKYTVLMSVYYKEKPEYFEEAVNSMLNQTYPPDEIVLVCDGPLTDGLERKIDLFEAKHTGLFKLVRLTKNQGLGKALAVGLKECSNEIVARMDTDDIAVSDRMKCQMEYLDKHKDVSAVGGQIQEFNETIDRKMGLRCVETDPVSVRKSAAKRNPMNHMTVTFRKGHVLAAGNYQEYDRFEDYFLWARMLAKGYQLSNIDSICVFARVNSNMYRRRAGMDYFKQTVQMQKYLLSAGISNRIQFVSNLIVRFMGTVVVPNGLREKLYNSLMRKKG